MNNTSSASPAPFQLHWSLVPPDQAPGLAADGTRLLAIWPAPVNHDACFEAAGFTLFGDNDETWDQAAEDLLRRVIEHLSRFGAPRLVSAPLRDDPPWYLRPFRTGRELPLWEQALLPMKCDSLPLFQARFGENGAALRTSNGHFLLWVSLPGPGSAPSEFVRNVAPPWEALETRLRWRNLLPIVEEGNG
ncbi:hypothetical protein [Bordetella petrii]|uniref:hypothetical protein n=1 Tax=Bordetella petrii TaxID=94624 RepID=UPI001A970DD0|nr:hypothetical protein [Bordetella petrii]MBO1110622.1 hypothetical protein [Bordetella petrii]